MHLHVSAAEIALRLVLTVLAGAVIGFNREQHGGPAGLRTTVLVCLAAALAMIQMNLLLPVDGKTTASFGVMDMMRLPLGILSGIGFIGGGAILRRGGTVDGVTTAATIWLATVVGLCLGGGQLWLGLAGTGVAALVLWPAKWIDRHMASWRCRRATARRAQPISTSACRHLARAPGSPASTARRRSRSLATSCIGGPGRTSISARRCWTSCRIATASSRSRSTAEPYPPVYPPMIGRISPVM